MDDFIKCDACENWRYIDAESCIDCEFAARGIAAIDWALSQDFAPDHAERVRRDAWRRNI